MALEVSTTKRNRSPSGALFVGAAIAAPSASSQRDNTAWEVFIKICANELLGTAKLDSLVAIGSLDLARHFCQRILDGLNKHQATGEHAAGGDDRVAFGKVIRDY